MNLKKLLRWGKPDDVPIHIHRAPIRPTFEFHLNLGILRLHTALWRDSYYDDCRDYVMLFFEFWGREVFRFRLYETGMSIMQRKSRAAS